MTFALENRCISSDWFAPSYYTHYVQDWVLVKLTQYQDLAKNANNKL